MADAFIQFDGVGKSFAGVRALDGVSLSIARGECHALMGENGAGKSTLGKILAGLYRPDNGEVRIDGLGKVFHSPADAKTAGVGMVHQELAFCPDLSVAENLCMGDYPRRLALLAHRREMNRRARALLDRIGVQMDVEQSMRNLSTAQEQLVQIASAVGLGGAGGARGGGANILIFDEPTSSLSEPEAQRLFVLIEDLKRRGVTMIYVSHRMPEVFRLCDRVSVLRDGKYVGTLDKSDATEGRVVQMMIGRSLEQYFPRHLSEKIGQTMLRVESLSSPGKFKDVSFQIKAGEIVGFAGLVGSGRSEIAKAIFGLDAQRSGSVIIEGQPLTAGSVRAAMSRGVGLVPEDRKRQGLVLMMSGRGNFSLAMLDRLNRLGLLDFSAEQREAADYFTRLRVKTPSLATPVAGLSGGNQQKVVLAKWLARGAKLLIVDEPTRGVDVGAKAAIHEIIDDLARAGVAILLISSELPELLNLSTRILVMREGALVGQLSRSEATQDNVLRLMAGVGKESVSQRN